MPSGTDSITTAAIEDVRASTRRAAHFADGRLETVQTLASDLMVVNAARASFGTHNDALADGDDRLINYLMREKHASPFEHGLFTFRVKAPLFVARQWFRHRSGSFNEESGRYSIIASEFFLPMGDEIRTQTGKPGAYTFSPCDPSTSKVATGLLANAYGTAAGTYEKLLTMGVAKEVARMCLPLATMTTFVWSVNPRNLINFLVLRTSEHTQYETRMYADAVERAFAEVMPLTYIAWTENGRTSL